ncbi:hypothetical protein NUU61_000589 [Penicillium alfredii]|uniref:Uncharacterized protein n=1 Tax=Penicillium alfredii TaxID=1506179 RepID=A0A9W9GB85_9EURO|nr:uncharacterized protein NUU61_000589 [Penicillium alfredii]KAJ5114830.1 hypothetical protein NUU61_000589 [Penicillium alfredii]
MENGWAPLPRTHLSQIPGPGIPSGSNMQDDLTHRLHRLDFPETLPTQWVSDRSKIPVEP